MEDIQEFEIEFEPTIPEFEVEMSAVVLEVNGDYIKLKNKPQINNVTLEGNTSLEALGITESYSKDEINQMISSIPKFSIEVVTELPTENISNTTVYLLVSGNENMNMYDEYIYVNGTWEKLGTQTIDLTNYATKDYVDNKINEWVTISDETLTEETKIYSKDFDDCSEIEVIVKIPKQENNMGEFLPYVNNVRYNTYYNLGANLYATFGFGAYMIDGDKIRVIYYGGLQNESKIPTDVRYNNSKRYLSTIPANAINNVKVTFWASSMPIGTEIIIYGKKFSK